MTRVLGISAFYHDSAAVLVVDGQVVAAAQEERFTRRKHDASFPRQAIAYCLEQGGLEPSELDAVGFYEKPLLKFDRLLETYLAFAPRGFRSFSKALPVWLKQKLHIPRELDLGLGHGYRKGYVFPEHHESHAASAFFPSPFAEAAILTFDGVGEWASASLGVGRGDRIELRQELRFPHSLGLLYSAFTAYCGFEVNDGEYKLMGLAPYGEPRLYDQIMAELLDLKEDGSFRLDLSYFDYAHGLTMTGEKLHRLLGAPPRRPGEALRDIDLDAAASIQKVTEQVVGRAARHLHRLTGLDRLCLAGGVALNCVVNGRLLSDGPFQEIWIQPAAGDAGGALGAALLISHQLLGVPRQPKPSDAMQGARLGDAWEAEAIASFLTGASARFQRLDDTALRHERVAAELASGRVVGWFQGRMEFGPRALGGRSILADPRREGMQSLINQKVKFREGFRPFAPVVLAEHAGDYFDIPPGRESPYMLLVVPVRQDLRPEPPAGAAPARGLARLQETRSLIPAVTHVDGSARLQTLDHARDPDLHDLLSRFHRLTGCPLLVNTSFNLGWEPIVRTPEEAYRTFMASGLDLLCLGPFLIDKREQVVREWPGPASREDRVLDPCLRSPCCAATLEREPGKLTCAVCRGDFPLADGIAQLFLPEDNPRSVTSVVRQFYEENPFPHYPPQESLRSLIDKARRGLYARLLDASIPYNSRVLEVGCGTGQLTNFLGASCRQVIGTDLSLASLRLGEEFRRRHDLGGVRFLQMNLFRPVFRPECFDVVLCNGVLHHTADPYRGFTTLLELVRPGGHIVVGLYGRYGRLFTHLRKALFALTGGRGQALDPVLRSSDMGDRKRSAWFADQYRHPHESSHAFGEILEWFDRAGVEFVRGVPAMRLEDDGLGGPSLFAPQPRGSALDRFFSQAAQLLEGSREGGFFLMIGRKPARPGAMPPGEA